MKFNEHSKLSGQHAFLSASNYHWLNYDNDKLTDRYLKHQAVQRGTELHQLACDHIRLGVKMSRAKRTLDMYVNDAIQYNMTPEVVLYYSPNCFGTADTISFQNMFLRIHDYKSGENDTSFNQLKIYAALFCLEYHYKPEELAGIELRIYQNDEYRVMIPEPNDIHTIMNTIIAFDIQIEKLKNRET